MSTPETPFEHCILDALDGYAALSVLTLAARLHRSPGHVRSALRALRASGCVESLGKGYYRRADAPSGKPCSIRTMPERTKPAYDALARSSWRNAQDIAASLGCTPAWTQNLLSQLRRSGFAEQNPNDRRQWRRADPNRPRRSSKDLVAFNAARRRGHDRRCERIKKEIAAHLLRVPGASTGALKRTLNYSKDRLQEALEELHAEEILVRRGAWHVHASSPHRNPYQEAVEARDHDALDARLHRLIQAGGLMTAEQIAAKARISRTALGRALARLIDAKVIGRLRRPLEVARYGSLFFALDDLLLALPEQGWVGGDRILALGGPSGRIIVHDATLRGLVERTPERIAGNAATAYVRLAWRGQERRNHRSREAGAPAGTAILAAEKLYLPEPKPLTLEVLELLSDRDGMREPALLTTLRSRQPYGGWVKRLVQQGIVDARTIDGEVRWLTASAYARFLLGLRRR